MHLKREKICREFKIEIFTVQRLFYRCISKNDSYDQINKRHTDKWCIINLSVLPLTCYIIATLFQNKEYINTDGNKVHNVSTVHSSGEGRTPSGTGKFVCLATDNVLEKSFSHLIGQRYESFQGGCVV